MKKKSMHFGRPALDVIEDAVHLLRTTPARVLLAYYVGAIPFALGLLFFWADMSCGAYAERSAPAYALGMALLFIWMKCWQAVFTSLLHARLAAMPPSRWDLLRILRLILVQGITQPSRIFLLPAAAIVTIPFAWVLAFYENVTVLGDGMEGGIRTVWHRAGAQTRLWPKQNHVLLLLLLLVAVVLWLNALIAVYTVPQLLKMFLGIETAFSRSGKLVIFNSTFLAVTIALAWLALDPLLKAVYTLRCFHGEARKDGADLLAELSLARASARATSMAALIISVLLPLNTRGAGETNARPVAASAPSVATPAQIDKAISDTLKHDKYAWRMPREKSAEDDSVAKGWLRSFFSSIGNTIADWAHSVGRWLRSIIDWFNKHFVPKSKPSSSAAPATNDWAISLLRWLAYALILLAAAALVLLVVRWWRRGWRRSAAVRAELVAASPDLNDENVTAAQLPEDEWLKLARELLNKGDLRLALRAFYLATLAHLAAREIVSIARFKSNRDYETEVNRRARGSQELRAAFSANVGAFDRVWYGLYDVSAEAVMQFQSNFERIRSC